MPYPGKQARSGWTGPWVTWSSWKCSCSLQKCWTRSPFIGPFQGTFQRKLFYDSMMLLLILWFSFTGHPWGKLGSAFYTPIILHWIRSPYTPGSVPSLNLSPYERCYSLKHPSGPVLGSLTHSRMSFVQGSPEMDPTSSQCLISIEQRRRGFARRVHCSLTVALLTFRTSGSFLP